VTDDLAFWDELAPTAHFTHPINVELIRGVCESSGRVLDFGCGYGRALAALTDVGFTRLVGIDPSPEMIVRARIEVPQADFDTFGGSSTPFEPDSFDVVLLVAVLTCVPDPDDQRDIVDEITRVLRPGGHVYVSDFLLQTDDRRVERYRRFAEQGFRYGVFQIDEGRVTLRHHEQSYLDDLFAGFDLVSRRDFDLDTMKGNPARGIQMMLRKRLRQ